MPVTLLVVLVFTPLVPERTTKGALGLWVSGLLAVLGAALVPGHVSVEFVGAGGR